jgi:hypothetical protein
LELIGFLINAVDKPVVIIDNYLAWIMIETKLQKVLKVRFMKLN